MIRLSLHTLALNLPPQMKYYWRHTSNNDWPYMALAGRSWFRSIFKCLHDHSKSLRGWATFTHSYTLQPVAFTIQGLGPEPLTRALIETHGEHTNKRCWTDSESNPSNPQCCPLSCSNRKPSHPKCPLWQTCVSARISGTPIERDSLQDSHVSSCPADISGWDAGRPWLVSMYSLTITYPAPPLPSSPFLIFLHTSARSYPFRLLW